MKTDHMLYLIKSLHGSVGMTVSLLNEAKELTSCEEFEQVHNPAFVQKKDQLEYICQTALILKHPIIQTSPYQERYILFPLEKNGYLQLGPTAPPHYTAEKQKAVLKDLHSLKDTAEFTEYFAQLPVFSKEQLIHVLQLVYYSLYQQPYDASHISVFSSAEQEVTTSIENPNLYLSKQRQDIAFHHDPALEQDLLHAIRTGNKAAIHRYLDHFPEEQFGLLSKDSNIRSRKNLIIAAITIVTRAAMKAGVLPETAYTLSDLYIQRLEELKDMENVIKLHREAMLAFAETVEKSRNTMYSKPIAVCVNYIFQHLYEEITLTELSALIGMHPNYLSARFKKETGETVTTYIQRVRIDEAKHLLITTDYSLLAIANWLSFQDQSYFTKVFKKFTGITPKQFRINN